MLYYSDKMEEEREGRNEGGMEGRISMKLNGPKFDKWEFFHMAGKSVLEKMA